MQRGMRLLLNIVEYRESNGALPATISDLPGAPVLEAYTGNPFHYANLGNNFGFTRNGKIATTTAGAG